jgi:hypothetical protein
LKRVKTQRSAKYTIAKLKIQATQSFSNHLKHYHSISNETLTLTKSAFFPLLEDFFTRISDNLKIETAKLIGERTNFLRTFD